MEEMLRQAPSLGAADPQSDQRDRVGQKTGRMVNLLIWRTNLRSGEQAGQGEGTQQERY